MMIDNDDDDDEGGGGGGGFNDGDGVMIMVVVVVMMMMTMMKAMTMCDSVPCPGYPCPQCHQLRFRPRRGHLHHHRPALRRGREPAGRAE